MGGMKPSARQITMTAAISALLGLVPAAATAADAAAGKAVFAAKCKTCHAEDGTGNPAIAKMMKVDLKPLGGAEVQKKSDAELKAAVSEGTGKMKAVAGVAGADLDNVVAAVRALKK